MNTTDPMQAFEATVSEILRKAVKYPNERVDPYHIKQLTAAAVSLVEGELSKYWPMEAAVERAADKCYDLSYPDCQDLIAELKERS